MENFYVISFDRGDTFINLIQAEDRDKANEKFEEEMSTNFSTDIMLDNDEFEKFCEVVKDFKAVEDKIYNEEIKKDLIRDEVRDVADEYSSSDDIDEEMEVKADLKRKYDNPVEAENQENFCN